MIEFRVTGETAEEFARNAMQAYAVLACGLQTVIPELAPTAPTNPDYFPASDQVGAAAPEAKPEQISQRLSEVITAAADRGWPHQRCNKYARKLLASIGGAVRIRDIDTDAKRADFMAKSEAFLAGTAAE